MKFNELSRRQFLRTTTALAGAAAVAPWALNRVHAETTKRTATDQVTLGKTGIKLSRLGFGTGSSNGHEQTAAGKQEFIKLIHYAYDQGITYIDTAQRYATFTWIGDAIKGLPREKLFIQSKVPGQPDDVLATIDNHRKTFDTDYVDSLLVHCMTSGNWTDQWKRVMDGFNEAKEKKWIRAKGVSCHSLPALRKAVASDWTDVHLVRINPAGHRMDDESPALWGDTDVEVPPVVEQIKTMNAKGHGVIGMKIYGNGDFRKAEQREKSLRFALGLKEVDAMVIGFINAKQIDETIQRMNTILAEG